jgi:hypothetical protein
MICAVKVVEQKKYTFPREKEIKDLIGFKKERCSILIRGFGINR